MAGDRDGSDRWKGDRESSWSPEGKPRHPNHEERQNERERDGGRSGRQRRRDFEEEETPTASVCIRGLPPISNEDSLYASLGRWAPLLDVRVIREKMTGVSRGFAFVDFPSVEAAMAMKREAQQSGGLYIDGRRVYVDYSKPHISEGGERFPLSDWLCSACGADNFARRVECFKCGISKAASMDGSFSGQKMALNPSSVLVVRGLEEDALEDTLRYEFSKYVPVKDLRMVRDKFTHVCKGFAFVHFFTADDAKLALEKVNGIQLEKNGPIIKVSFARDGLGKLGEGLNQNEAPGWQPQEYRGGSDMVQGESAVQNHNNNSGFVWDESSGYYFNSASGMYYDGYSGLYYDSTLCQWYSLDPSTNQYVPCVNPNSAPNPEEASEKDPSAVVVPQENSQVVSGAVEGSESTVAPKPPGESEESKTSKEEALRRAAMAAAKAEREREKQREKEKEAQKKRALEQMALWKIRQSEAEVPQTKAKPMGVGQVVANGGVGGRGRGRGGTATWQFQTPLLDSSVRVSIGAQSYSTESPLLSENNGSSLEAAERAFKSDFSAVEKVKTPSQPSGRRRFSEVKASK